MALKKVKGNFERIFDKNLTDLVRGIRNNKDNEVIVERISKIPIASPRSLIFATHLPTRNAQQTTTKTSNASKKSWQEKSIGPIQIPICSSSIRYSNTPRALVCIWIQFSRLTRTFHWQVDGEEDEEGNWRVLKFQFILSISFLKQWVWGTNQLCICSFSGQVHSPMYRRDKTRATAGQHECQVQCSCQTHIRKYMKPETFSKQTFSGWMGFEQLTLLFWFLVSMILIFEEYGMFGCSSLGDKIKL